MSAQRTLHWGLELSRIAADRRPATREERRARLERDVAAASERIRARLAALGVAMPADAR